MVSNVLEAYEKDLVARAELNIRDLMFLEPEEIAAEMKNRITVERATEIRALLNLTSLKGLTLPTAKELYAAGHDSKYRLLETDAKEVVKQVNAQRAIEGRAPLDEKEERKLAKILESNQDVLDEW